MPPEVGVSSRLAGLIRQTRRQAEALEKLSRTDPLKGSVNRRHPAQELEREMTRARRTGSPLTLAFVDLDHFKRFNDANGHAAGDGLLEQLVAAWRPLLRETDLLARIGGEEFVVLLPETSMEQAWQVVERMREHTPLGQTCSAGIARLQPEDTADSLICRADDAMYVAKRAGRNRTVMAHTNDDSVDGKAPRSPA